MIVTQNSYKRQAWYLVVITECFPHEFGDMRMVSPFTTSIQKNMLTFFLEIQIKTRMRHHLTSNKMTTLERKVIKKKALPWWYGFGDTETHSWSEGRNRYQHIWPQVRHLCHVSHEVQGPWQKRTRTQQNLLDMTGPLYSWTHINWGCLHTSSLGWGNHKPRPLKASIVDGFWGRKS